MNVNEIAALLEDPQYERNVGNVVMFPPADGFDTDEDSDVEDDEGEAMGADHLGPGLLSQQAEIELFDQDDELPDVVRIDAEGVEVARVENETADGGLEPAVAEAEAGPSRKRARSGQARPYLEPAEQLSRKKNNERIWSRTPSAASDKIPIFEEDVNMPVDDSIQEPYDFLKLFLSDKFLEEVSQTSKAYCIRKGKEEKAVLMTPDNIITSIGILYLTGYSSPAQRKMFWQKKEDAQNMFVKKAMPRDLFEDVIGFTYFVTQDDQDDNDIYWKVRPLFETINNSAKKFVIQSQNVSIDETMVRYFGHHPAKQRIVEKPER